MTANLYLTDEKAEIEGYYRAKLGGRSDCPSLVRAASATVAGPTDGVQATRTTGGALLAWITDTLDGTDLTATAWSVHLWATAEAGSGAALRVQIFKFDSEEAGTPLLDDNPGTALGAVARELVRTTGVATATAMADGDRLVIKVLFDDATGGDMAAGKSCTLAYNGQYPRAEGDSYLVCPDGLALTAAMPASTRARLRRLLKDTSATNPLLGDDEVDQLFDSALRSYSGDRPRQAVELYSGDGATYKFPMPRGWIAGVSQILEVEYPADATNDQSRSLLEPADYEERVATLGVQPLRQLAFSVTPEAGTDNIAVGYTTRHLHNDELDTVPAEDLEAVLWLAAAYACETLATKMAGSSDSTLAADGINYRDAQLRYKQQAAEFKRLYDDRIHGVSESAGASGTMVDWDTAASWGADRVFHSRRWR